MAVRGVDREALLRVRIRTAFRIVLACYITLIARLVYLQGLHGMELSAQAHHERSHTIPLPSTRGSIYARDGQSLAASLATGTLIFDPSRLMDALHNPKLADRTRKRLSDSVVRIAAILDIPQADLDTFVQRACDSYPQQHRRYNPIRRGLNLEQIGMIRQARPALTGFDVIDDAVREYAGGADTAQVIGFLNDREAGAAGLERGCNRWLNGKDGHAVAELDKTGRAIPDTQGVVVPAQDGLDVQTTLDPSAQHIATEEAQQILSKYRPQGISVVIVEPASGDILALVSLPNYNANPDPAHPGTHLRMPAKGHPEGFKERCVGDTYEPGSTLKMLTVASALDSGIITPDSTYFCSGEFHLGRFHMHCAHGEVHHTVTPQDILRESCNIGAAQIGLQMGGKRLYEAERNFGLFDRYDLGLDLEYRGKWSAGGELKFNPVKTACVAFGQAITTTPLHVAMAYASIANGGVLATPRLVTRVTDGQGHVVQEWKPRSRRVVRAETAALVARMLRSVVSDGTARQIALRGYQIAGKTGTAQVANRGGNGRGYGHDSYIGSFAGFIPAAPTSKPRAVILVAVDRPDTTKGYYGAEVAAPAFKNIAKRLMDCWRVPEDDPDGAQALAALNSQRRKDHLKPLAALPEAHIVAN